MEILPALLFFGFGAIVGSFLNVVILRYNTGGSLGGRSHCFSCGKEIKWYDLVPVLSFLFLGGKCRFCKSRISYQYSLVELATGLLFLAVYLRSVYSGNFEHSIYFIILSIDLAVMAALVVISAYDLKHKIIPDAFAAIFGGLSLLATYILVPPELLFSWTGVFFYLLPGPIIALPFFLLWLISRGRWMGLGDAKLALGIGWFLGFSAGISAVIIGFWIGAAVSVSLLALAWLGRQGITRGTFLSAGLKSLTIGSEVPLAPFLILGFLIVYFFRVDVTGLSALVGM